MKEEEEKQSTRKKLWIAFSALLQRRHICIAAHWGQEAGASTVTNHRPELWKDYKSWTRKTE
jgi:hypothetical protein